MQEQANKILKCFNEFNESQSVVCESDLCNQLTEKLTLKVDGIKIGLCYLCNIGRASYRDAMIDNKSIRLYKLAALQTATSTELTPLDVSIYTLRRMEKSLIKSVEGIETDIKNTDNTVRKYLKEQKRQLAKSFLRKKHVLEKNLGKHETKASFHFYKLNNLYYNYFPDKTANALTTLQLLLMQVDETKHNASLVDALKLGSITLKSALEEKNITVDSVEDTLADVKEILDLNAEIQFALSGAQFNDIIGDNLDETALEDELKDLLDDSSPTKNANGIVPLPSSQAQKNNDQPTITNVIDELLEARLKNLTVDTGGINVTIANHTRDPMASHLK